MIKSIVLLAILLAVVVANPRELREMAEKDPVLEEVFRQATKLYRPNPEGPRTTTFSTPRSARSTPLKDLIEFDMDVTLEKCSGSSCTEEYNFVHVTCASQKGQTGYSYFFRETPAKETKHFKRC